jgi:hypothetical protein
MAEHGKEIVYYVEGLPIEMSLRGVNHVYPFFIEWFHPVCVDDEREENHNRDDHEDHEPMGL